MKNFNSELLTIEERKQVEDLIEKFSKDDRGFIRAFWVEPLSIKDDIWKIAFLNSQENYYAVITTDKVKEPLQEIINFLEEFINTKEKISININNFVLSIEVVDKKVLFQIYNEKNLVYKTYTTCSILITYLYINLMLFIREKYDFDIPYFNKDILSIYSNLLGRYNLVTDLSDEEAYDFYGASDAGDRWLQEKDNIKKAKWCLIAANAKRILIDNRFCYEYKGKIIKESEMCKLVFNMNTLIEMERNIFGDFIYCDIEYDKDDFTNNEMKWFGIVKCNIEICGSQSIAYLGSFSSSFDTEVEIHACIVTQYLFCKLGLDTTVFA